jgi:hypothetical protein
MPEKKYLTHGEGLPNWSNPISHAVVVNNMCFPSKHRLLLGTMRIKLYIN